MKKGFLFAFVLLFTFLASNAQRPGDCGCNAALRYDVFTYRSDFYSQMLLAREINRENYRELLQSAQGGISIFGIDLGANGENIERIKEVYREKLLNQNINRQLVEYESITTSDVSYRTYTECMKLCLRARAHGLQAYIVREDGNSVDIDLFYGTEPRNRTPLAVRYNYNGREVTIQARPNEFNPIHITRVDRRSFTLVFASGQYESEPVYIKPFAPLTASVTLNYNYTLERAGDDIAYSVVTNNNDNQRCGIHCENKLNIDRQVVGLIAGRAKEGGDRWDGAADNGQQFNATRIWFKVTAPGGYFLRNPQVSCVPNGNACTFTEDQQFLVNNSSQVVYTSKHYSLPVTIQFRVNTYKIDKLADQTWSFSTDASISFLVPKTTYNAIMRYGSGILELGQSNADFQLVGSPVETADGMKIYFYRILNPMAEKTMPDEIKNFKLDKRY